MRGVGARRRVMSGGHPRHLAGDAAAEAVGPVAGVAVAAPADDGDHRVVVFEGAKSQAELGPAEERCGAAGA